MEFQHMAACGQRKRQELFPRLDDQDGPNALPVELGDPLREHHFMAAEFLRQRHKAQDRAAFQRTSKKTE
jgi:hypothetical protein